MLLSFLGSHARWVLPFGLILGVAMPNAALFLANWIPHVIALLLLIACLQIKQVISVRNTLASVNFRWVVACQLVLPVLVWLVLSAVGMSSQWIVPAVLVASAAPVTGGPSLVIMLKGDARQALDFLLTGTLLLPLTCLPALFLINSTGSLHAVLVTAFKLLLLIASVLLMATVIRRYWSALDHYRQNRSLDGASAVCLAVVVIGLMAGFHDKSLQGNALILTMLWAIGLNATYQVLGYVFGRLSGMHPVTSGVSAGNRNIALFLTALPSETSTPLLLFIACYQIPMYLTPLVGGLFYPKTLEPN